MPHAKIRRGAAAAVNATRIEPGAGDTRKHLVAKGLVAFAGVCAAVVMALALRALATPHLLAGHHSEYHALRVLLVADLWRSGEFIPRWVPELAGGLGYPLFIYYGWLSYALAAELNVLGLDPVAALNAVTIAAALWQAVGAWMLGRELGGRAGGWVACVLFAFAPYQLVNLYVRGNFPEFVAGSFAPWALWTMVRLIARKSRWNMVGCAACLAASALCHNISGLTLGATITTVGLLFAGTLPAGQRKAGAGRVILASAAGAMLSAFFWLPILVGRHYVRLANDFSGYLDYRQHFLYLHQLVSTAWGYGFSLPGPDDTMPLQLGIAQVATLLVLAPLGAVLLRSSFSLRRVRLLGCALLALVLAFLTTRLSAWLWSIVTPLAVLQFPWRLHLPGTLLVAATGAMAVRVLAAPRWWRWRWLRPEVLLAVCAALALAATSLRHCRPLATYVCDEATLRKLLDLGYYTTSIQDEFRPVWANDLDGLGHLMRTEHAALDGVPIAEAKLPEPEQRGRFALHAQIEHAGELRLPIFWFPGWSISVDGVSQPSYPCAGTGVICTRVNAGAHVIAAAWRPTLVCHLGSALSLAALAGLVLFAIRRKRRAEINQVPDAGAL
jgi:hypothetical protein